MVHAVHSAGATADMIASVLGVRFLGVEGVLDGEASVDACFISHPKVEHQTGRWFLSDPVHEDSSTCVLSKMWGTNTESALTALAQLVPDSGIAFAPA
jgi:hypothetical protein